MSLVFCIEFDAHSWVGDYAVVGELIEFHGSLFAFVTNSLPPTN
jgi:hypothetical protein